MGPPVKEGASVSTVGASLILPLVAVAVTTGSRAAVPEVHPDAGHPTEVQLARPAAGDTGDCWSPLEPLDIGPYRDSVLRNLSFLPDRRPPTVVGSHIRHRSDTATAERSRLVVATVGGESLRRPSGPFLFLTPRARAGTDGDIHLVWGEPFRDRPPDRDSLRRVLSSSERRSWNFLRRRSLWYSRYRDGGWSRPERLAAAEHDVDWAKNLGEVVVDGRNAVHVATAGDGGTLYLRLRDGEVRERTSLATDGLYPNLFVRGDTVVLAFVSQAPEEGKPRDRWFGSTVQVYLRRSPDGGSSWSEPMQIGPSARGEDYAVDLHLVSSPSVPDELDLAWIQTEDRREVLHAATVSLDAWEQTGTIDTTRLPPHPVTNVDAVPWPRGGLGVFYNSPVTPKIGFHYVAYRGGEWGPLQHPYPGLRLVTLDAVASGDEVHLLGYDHYRPEAKEPGDVRAVAAVLRADVGKPGGCEPLR